MPQTPNSTEYFAAASTDEIAGRVLGKIASSSLRKSGNSTRANWGQSYRHSYASVETGEGSAAFLLRDGAEGELSRVRVNHARATQRALLGLLLGPRIAWRPVARNGDMGARGAILKAQNLLEWLWKARHLGRTVSRWADQALRHGEAYVFAQWDYARGPVAGPSGERGGDLYVQNVAPWHVFVDEAYTDPSRCPWRCVRTFESRWNLEALYQVDAMGKPTAGQFSAGSNESLRETYDGQSLRNAEDVVPVLHFFHEPTGAMPEGRETMLVGDVVLRDGPLRYGRIPVVRFAPDEMDDAMHGYSPFFDVLGIQEEADGIESAVASNLLTFATQSVVLEEGTKASPDDVQGMRAFYVRPGGRPPSSLMLAEVPKGAFEHLDRLRQAQQSILGLNDVAMGQPDTAQMNAEAFSILAGMAQQRNAPIQAAFSDSVSELGSLCLDTMRRFVSEPRQIAIAGKGAENFSRMDYSGKDLEPIESVLVDIGNALEQSVPGRFQLAQLYSQMGVLKTPEQLQQVLESGRMEAALNTARTTELLAASENDDITQGKAPVVHFLDDHVAHCKLHAAILNNPSLRSQQSAIQAAHQHLDAHYLQFYALPPGTTPQMDPEYATRIRVLLGQEAPQLAPPPPPEGAAPPVEGVEAALSSPVAPPPGTGQPPSPV